MSYSSSSNQYPPPHQYYPNANVDNPISISPPQSRPEMAQRKRPKYTRSKTGCLTCRVKKIKCDETKPNCMRCTHGSRECSWPEGVPTRKKSVARREDPDSRPSTAGSSGLSEASTPPARDITPPRRNQVDLNLLPLPPRAPNDNFIPIHPMNSEHESSRRHLERVSAYSNSHPSTNPNVLSMIPESSYPQRYEQPYLNGTSPMQPSRQSLSTPYRPPSHQPTNHWNQSPEPLNSYYNNHQGPTHGRPLIGHTSPNDHSNTRYP